MLSLSRFEDLLDLPHVRKTVQEWNERITPDDLLQTFLSSLQVCLCEHTAAVAPAHHNASWHKVMQIATAHALDVKGIDAFLAQAKQAMPFVTNTEKELEMTEWIMPIHTMCIVFHSYYLAERFKYLSKAPEALRILEEFILLMQNSLQYHEKNVLSARELLIELMKEEAHRHHPSELKSCYEQLGKVQVPAALLLHYENVSPEMSVYQVFTDVFLGLHHTLQVYIEKHRSTLTQEEIGYLEGLRYCSELRMEELMCQKNATIDLLSRHRPYSEDSL